MKGIGVYASCCAPVSFLCRRYTFRSILRKQRSGGCSCFKTATMQWMETANFNSWMANHFSHFNSCIDFFHQTLSVVVLTLVTLTENQSLNETRKETELNGFHWNTCTHQFRVSHLGFHSSLKSGLFTLMYSNLQITGMLGHIPHSTRWITQSVQNQFMYIHICPPVTRLNIATLELPSHTITSNLKKA